MDYNAFYEKVQRNSIKLVIAPSDNNDFPIGISKFGGNPDLPQDFEWPYYCDKDFNGVTKNRPLSFLMQFSCAELVEFDIDNTLPKSGMLYFFYELVTQKWGFDPNDKGCARVYYFDGKTLVRTSFPLDMETDCKLPELRVKLSKKLDLPSYEEFAEHYESDEYDWDKYDEKRTSFGYELIEETDNRSKLLGYANNIQNDMLMECEMSTNGVYSGNTPNLSTEQRKKLSDNCTQWKLLLYYSQIKNLQQRGDMVKYKR